MSKNDMIYKWIKSKEKMVFKPHLSLSQSKFAWQVEKKCAQEVAEILAMKPERKRKKINVVYGSVWYRLLFEYRKEDLTAEEAAINSALNHKASYWRYVTDLVREGYLEDTGKKRKSYHSSGKQRVCRITQRGLDAL